MNIQEIKNSEKIEENHDKLIKKDSEKGKEKDSKPLDLENKNLSNENTELSKNEEKNNEKESKGNFQDINKGKDNLNSQTKSSEINIHKEKNNELKENYFNLDIAKESKKSDSFLLNKNRLLELNLTKSSSSLSNNLSIKKKCSSKSKKESENNDDYNEFEDNEEYSNDYNEEDLIEKEQIEILENMFIEAQNSEKEDKINLFSEIINLDETKEKIYSYKGYEEICLIYLKNEEHEKFIENYIKLRDIAHKIEISKVKTYIRYTAEKFIKEIITKTKDSINHWLEDISKDLIFFKKIQLLMLLKQI